MPFPLPPLAPVTPPPSSPSTSPFSTTLPTLPTSLNSTPSTPSIAPSPPRDRAHRMSVTLGNPLDDVADAFNVARLDALAAAVATLVLCVAALVEHRWARHARRYSSSAARQHTGNELDERSPSSAAWVMSGGYRALLGALFILDRSPCLRRSAARVQMHPDRGPSVCCSRTGALSIDYVEVQVSEKGEGGGCRWREHPETYPPPPATPSRATSMVILRPATTYKIRHLRTCALHHLNVFFPTTPLFKGWRDLGNRAATFPNILAAMCPDILADARECNAPFLAPACAYNL
ncbi:hypothetical protein FB107DRAFT_280941, partial [Schizophyllum commune]